MTDVPPLHQMNPTGRFTERAADYVKYRPSYPAAAIDTIIEGLGPPDKLVAADVGAGTGISSRLLADRRVRVIAVEPNAGMRQSAVAYPRVEWRARTGEATGLDAGAVDLVLCAQAFHWVRQDEATREFARILKPRGRMALMWNERDRSSAVMTGYRDAIRSVGREHPAELREFNPEVVNRVGLFSGMRLMEWPSTQRLDEAGLIGRAMSASYMPKEPDQVECVTRLLKELFARFREPDGMVTLHYMTRVWMWTKS